jgi:hypothetical protein
MAGKGAIERFFGETRRRPYPRVRKKKRDRERAEKHGRSLAKLRTIFPRAQAVFSTSGAAAVTRRQQRR